MERVEDAGVLVRSSEAFEAQIEFAWIVFGELGNGADAEQLKIAFDGWADGDKIAELAMWGHERSFCCSLYVRHRLRQTLTHSRRSTQEVFATEPVRKPCILAPPIILRPCSGVLTFFVYEEENRRAVERARLEF